MQIAQVKSERSRKEKARKVAVEQPVGAPLPKPEQHSAEPEHGVGQPAETVPAASGSEHAASTAPQPYPVLLLDMEKIVNSSFNPRKSFSEESLQELADSIAQVGVLQPICVRPKDEEFEIVYGERRYWAAERAGLKMIPVVVRELSDAEAEDAAITENLQREDVKPLEEAAAYSRALDSGRHTVESLVGKFGKSEAYIRSRLKLCALIDPLAELLDREEISVGVAIEIAKYDDKIQQEVFDEHFSESCRSSWKNARIKEVARRLYQRYMTQLDTYRFDKSECRSCMSNTANQVLFRDCTDGCAGCQNMECMIRKNEAFLTQKAIDLQHNDPRTVIAGDDDAPASVIEALLEEGYHVEPLEYSYYEMTSGPQQPTPPAPEAFDEIKTYNDAMARYQQALEVFEEESRELEFGISEGRILKYAVIGALDVAILYAEAAGQNDGEYQTQSGDRTVLVTRVPESPREGLLRKDHRNRQLCYERITGDLKKMLQEVKVSNKPLAKSETQLFHYAVMRQLGDRQVLQCGFKTESKGLVTREERYAAAGRPTEKQRAALMRQFIVRFLCQTAPDYNCTDETLDTRLLCEFVEMNFAEQTRPIMEKYKELYDKRKSRLDEQIDALDALERERELRASLEAATDSEPAEIPEAAPDEEPTVYEPAVVPLEPEIDFDLSLRPAHAELPAAA